MKTIRDAVHGDMTFDAVEMAVVDTAAVQRLRGVKQLGMASLVFPSAVHTRFEHSLGTCWLAKRMLSFLAGNGSASTFAIAKAIRLAALLHDVTHVPFGHTIEDERRLFPRHDEDAGRLDHFLTSTDLRSALDRSGVGLEVREILTGGPNVPPFARQIVTGTICADLLDYLKRDAFFCGLTLDYDDRLFQCFVEVDGQLAVRLHKRSGFRRDAMSELVSLLQMRYALTERVYYHHAKVVAGAMFSRILELALATGTIAREELCELKDDGLFAVLAERAKGQGRLAELLDDLAARRLFRRAFVLGLAGVGRGGVSEAERDALSSRFHLDRRARELAEAAIAADLGVPSEHVIVYCPSPKMALKEADVPVEIAPGQVVALSTLGHPDVAALREKHRALWRLMVCVRGVEGALPPNAGAACERAIGHANQLANLERGELNFGRL